MLCYSKKSVHEKYNALTKLLIQRNLSITTMESCTSGQIASLITDIEGASAIIKGAFVTYSNEAKTAAGVKAETIEKYGVYSKETAGEMAAVCRKAFNADIGIGVTGTFGNLDLQNKDSVPGKVFFAVEVNSAAVKVGSLAAKAECSAGDCSAASQTVAAELHLPAGLSRYESKLYVAAALADALQALLG